MGFKLDPTEAFRGIQPGAAPGLFSSNLTNAIPLTTFKYNFKGDFNPVPGIATQASPGASQNIYGFSQGDWANLDSQAKQMAILMNANRTTPEQQMQQRRELMELQNEYDKKRGDQAQQYALVNGIINSLGSIGRNAGSRYGSDPDAVAAAAQRMAGLSASGPGLTPLPNVPAVRYYNV
jgi:hypothetical protein